MLFSASDWWIGGRISRPALPPDRGETGRSSFTRGLEHGDHLAKMNKGQPLSDHARTKHPGADMKIGYFSMEVTGSYNRALPRIVSEGLNIDRLLQQKQVNPAKVEIMNSKTNFHQARVIRLVPQDHINILLN